VSAEKKREMIELVRRSPQPKRATIAELGMARSTFYRWQRRYRDQGEAGLLDRKPEAGAVTVCDPKSRRWSWKARCSSPI